MDLIVFGLVLFTMCVLFYLVWTRHPRVIEREVIKEIPVEVKQTLDEKQNEIERKQRIEKLKMQQREFQELMNYDVHVAYRKKEVD